MVNHRFDKSQYVQFSSSHEGAHKILEDWGQKVFVENIIMCWHFQHPNDEPRFICCCCCSCWHIMCSHLPWRLRSWASLVRKLLAESTDLVASFQWESMAFCLYAWGYFWWKPVRACAALDDIVRLPRYPKRVIKSFSQKIRPSSYVFAWIRPSIARSIPAIIFLPWIAWGVCFRPISKFLACLTAGRFVLQDSVFSW